MNIKEEMKAEEKQEFCTNNGLVMRTIITFFKRGWFKSEELLSSLYGYDLKTADVVDAIDYFADKGYIKTRDSETHEEVCPCDVDFEELEIRLHADGMLLGKHLTSDIGIEL